MYPFLRRAVRTRTDSRPNSRTRTDQLCTQSNTLSVAPILGNVCLEFNDKQHLIGRVPETESKSNGLLGILISQFGGDLLYIRIYMSDLDQAHSKEDILVSM